MATTERTAEERQVVVKEMSWDPITRIVGSLGIHTEIDFTNQEVLKCYSTSMIFRGFDIFMKGIDPRDAHFITSRICGICGDNHATCSCLNQNMAYGVKPPKLGDYAFNLAESADYMFDHAIFNDCMANVDFCEQMVKETNPSVLAKAEQTSAEHSSIHGYRTIADIMRALNPFTGEFYLETLHVARYTREMYCLFGGRHTHPSTIMPGGCSANITHQTMTDYYVRLMRYFEYVQAHRADARRPLRLLLRGPAGLREGRLPRHEPRLLGRVRRPRHRRLRLPTMTDWGNRRFITPGIAINGELVTTDLVEINVMIRILLGSSYFDSWENEQHVGHGGPAREPDRQEPPVEQDDDPEAAGSATSRTSTAGSPRRGSTTSGPDTYVCCDTGGGPFARQWVTAKAGLRRPRLPQGDGREHPDDAAEDGEHARDGARVEGPAVVERDRARPGPLLPPGVLGARRPLQPREGARSRCAPAGRRAGTTSRCRRRRSASASTRRRAGSSRTTW